MVWEPLKEILAPQTGDCAPRPQITPTSVLPPYMREGAFLCRTYRRLGQVGSIQPCRFAADYKNFVGLEFARILLFCTPTLN